MQAASADTNANMIVTKANTALSTRITPLSMLGSMCH
jgi:hypothetical protein